MQQRIAAIMAGGSGERFWPLSRKNRPKQLLPLTASGKPLIEETIDRFAPLIPADNRFLLASREVCAALAEADIPLPAANRIAEPCKRNTAGCLALAAAHLLARNEAPPESITMTILPADGWIGRVEAYQQALVAAMEAAEASPIIAVIGLKPTGPETGYGYIEIPEKDAPPFTASNGIPVHTVASFREKPDQPTATAYLESGRFLWNSGIFVWRLSTFLTEMESASPIHFAAIQAMADALRNNNTKEADRLFESLPSISIDYALMEKAAGVQVVPGDFEWDDIGTWTAVQRLLPIDAQGNLVAGAPVMIDVKDCIIFQDDKASHMAVAALGIRDLAVVVTHDAVLVMHKDATQEVRKIVEALKDRNAPQI